MSTTDTSISNVTLNPSATSVFSSTAAPGEAEPFNPSGATEYLNSLYGSLANLRDELRDAGRSENAIAARIRKCEASFDFRAEATALLNGGEAPAQPKPLPIIRLPGGDQPISDTAAKLGRQLANAQTHFDKGGAVVRAVADAAGRMTLAEISPAELASDLEGVAKLMAKDRKGDIKLATCSEGTAKLILASRNFVEELPPLRVLSRCPVLVEQEGELRLAVGYDAISGILAQGEAPMEMMVEEAVQLFDELLADFQFATPSDRSRALAAIITPALIMGNLLPGRAALDLGEADDSQSGKGYRHKLTAAIYGQTLSTVVQQRSGVGSMEEAFDRALIAGKIFISLDNVRGRIDSPKIESFLTEDSYNARCSFSRNLEIDPRRVCVMFTSNKADVTKDLANRSSCVRIMKQPDTYQYRRYPEGDILDRVRAQQPRYLGAVFAVVRAWHAAGKPRTEDTRHDFKAWAQTLDWIVQNLLGAAPLLDGHRETQQRMTNPALNWLRDVTLAVVRQGKASQWLIASDILDCIEEAGDIVTPGLREGANLEDDLVRRQALSQIGKLMKRCFSGGDTVEVDGLGIDREYYRDELYHERLKYVVYRLGDPMPGLPF